MGIEKIYPARSKDAKEVLLFRQKFDRELFLNSERARLMNFRAHEPMGVYRWDMDAQQEKLVRTPDGPRTTLTDSELAEALARLKSYKHGDRAEKWDGAMITLSKSAGKSRDYTAPGGFAPKYPLTVGAGQIASFPSKLKNWQKRLSDPSVRPGSASVLVTLTGDHLPSGTPPKWEVKKTDDNEWRITTGNSYVYNQETNDDE